MQLNWKFLAGITAAVTLLSACGTIQKNSRAGLADVKSEGGLFGGGIRSSRMVARPLGDEIAGVKIENKDFDIPVVHNDEVEKWVKYFTGKGRGHFAIYLERLGQMQPVIIPRLRDAGMPEDLIYLAMIESGFSTRARSHANAVGPWQFIKGTGRLFDLEINAWTDERRDPYKSTDAAVRYLKRLYDEFGSWELACASYNAGELKIRNAMAKLGTNDFWEIIKHRRALKRETKDYVPKMMAAAIVAKNAEAFGFEPVKQHDFWTDTKFVRLPKAEDMRNIARVAGVDKELIKELNPELTRSCTPPGAPYSLRLPKGDSFDRVYAAIEKGELGTFQDFQKITVKRGDSLSRIASRNKIPSDAILALNDLKGAHQIRPGMELVVPGQNFESYEPKIASRRSSRHNNRRLASSGRMELARSNAPAGGFTYTVKQGDTLYAISRRYATSTDKIREWNSISHSKKLRPGSRLKLYVKNET